MMEDPASSKSKRKNVGLGGKKGGGGGIPSQPKRNKEGTFSNASKAMKISSYCTAPLS